MNFKMDELDKTIFLSFTITLNVIGLKAALDNSIIEFLFFGTNISTFFYLPVAIVISFSSFYILNGRERKRELIIKASFISILATITHRLISELSTDN